MGQPEMALPRWGAIGEVTYTPTLGTLWEQKHLHRRSVPLGNQGLQLGSRRFVEFESLRFRHIQSPDYSGLFAFLGLVKWASGAGQFKGVSECPLCLLHVWLQRLALP